MTRSPAFYLLIASEPNTDWRIDVEIYKTVDTGFL